MLGGARSSFLVIHHTQHWKYFKFSEEFRQLVNQSSSVGTKHAFLVIFICNIFKDIGNKIIVFASNLFLLLIDENIFVFWKWLSHLKMIVSEWITNPAQNPMLKWRTSTLKCHIICFPDLRWLHRSRKNVIKKCDHDHDFMIKVKF